MRVCVLGYFSINIRACMCKIFPLNACVSVYFIPSCSQHAGKESMSGFLKTCRHVVVTTRKERYWLDLLAVSRMNCDIFCHLSFSPTKVLSPKRRIIRDLDFLFIFFSYFFCSCARFLVQMKLFWEFPSDSQICGYHKSNNSQLAWITKYKCTAINTIIFH